MKQPDYCEGSTFSPHVTVATVVEHEGRFLLVEERCSGNVVLNQPAGHLDPEENLIQAAIRETLEETGWHIDIIGVLGIQLYRAPSNGVTYHRTTFIGKPIRQEANAVLDEGIIDAIWMTPDELKIAQDKHRSPLVLQAVEQYLTGVCYPVSMLSTHI